MSTSSAAPTAADLLDPRVIADPHPLYRRLLADAPVWDVTGGWLYAVSSFDLVAETTSRVDDFSSNIEHLLYRDGRTIERVPFGDASLQALATADPPIHAAHRGAVFPELVARRMGALEPEIDAIARSCVDGAVRAGAVDFMTTVADVVPITVINRLIGFRDADPARLLAAAFDSTAMLGLTLSMAELGELMERTAQIQEWIGGQLSTARVDPGDDLLGAVARAVGDGVLDDTQAGVVLHTLLSAGGESTTSLLGSAVRLLAEDTELQARLRRDPDRVPVFVEEALRLEPPFRFHMRSTHHDTELGGVRIPAGSTVLLLWGAANRDPAEFDRPADVVLDRKVPRHHVAFGRGLHHCVGAALARVEARSVLTALLERTAHIALDPREAPTWVDSLMIRRHARLPVELTAA